MDPASLQNPPLSADLKLETGSRRDACLAYLNAVEASMRGQVLQLESLASHGAWIQHVLDETSPVLQAARALETSLTNLQSILRGNIALVQEVHRIKSQSARPPESAAQQSSSSAQGTESHPRAWEEPTEALLPCPDNRPVPDTPTYPTPQPRYHAGVLDIQGFKLFEPASPSPDASAHESAPPCSRRVVLGNLPPGVTPAEVLRGFTHRRIRSIAMLPATLSGGDGGTSSCLLEFVDPEAAARFAGDARSRGLAYAGARGRVHRATAWVIPTPSFCGGSYEAQALSARRTRTVAVRNLRGAAISRFLRSVGVRAVVDVRRAGAELVVEFAAVHDAARVVRLSKRLAAFADLGCRGRPLGVRMVCDVYARREAGEACDGAVGGYAPGDVEGLWDREPFDSHWPLEEDASRGGLASVSADDKVEDEARCSWEEYGRLARRRRDRAVEVRLRGGDTPAWWGDIKSAGTPAIITAYLDTRTITVVDTTA